jgi:cytochrome c biogenesis protein CcmG/thiol:disulfide interchange protein DsbE
MNRQWLMVGAIVAGLGLGAWALTRYAAPPEGPQMGQRAPDYKVLQPTTGDSIALRSHYAGHVTLVNIWATWCGPCRKEMPSMERLYQRYKDRGLRIAAVSIDEGDDAAVTAFGKDLALTFDLLHDRSGQIQQVYQTVGVPQSWLLDQRGRIVDVSIGGETWDSPEHLARIDALLGSR